MDLAETPDPPPDDADADSETLSGSWLQILANYATLLVAVSAVLLSVWQGYEMRQHNRLSVLPNLDVTVRQLTVERGEQLEFAGMRESVPQPTHFLGVSIENTGLGPAVVQKAKLFRAGADTSLYETTEDGDVVNISRADSLIDRMRAQFPEMGRFSGGIEQGTMMKAGGEQLLLAVSIPVASVPDTLDEFPPRKAAEMVSRYSFVICYCSVYGEDCDQEPIGADPPADACRF
jgi:hypothetical protein